MKLIKTLALLLMSGMLFISCEKEYSEEVGGGGGIAAGTLKAAGSGECLPSSVGGIFIANKILTTANYIDVTVNLTALGAYNITTDVVNGYSFSGVGIATATGDQTIRLKGTGTPTAAGANTFAVKFGTSVCNIVVDVYPVGTGNAVLTVDCTGATLGGTFKQNVAMTSANTATINVVVATAGTYDISTTAVNGVTFRGTGFFTMGAHTLTLTATGTPTASGVKTYTVTSGASSCTFDVDYAVGTTTPPVSGTNTWSFKARGITYSGTIIESETEVQLTSPGGGFGINGETPDGDGFSLAVKNFTGAFTATTYPGIPVGSPTPTGRATLVCFYESSSSDTTYDYIIMAKGNISTTVSVINTSTRTIQGTFSGTALDENNAVVNITEGKFSARYP